MGFIQPKDKTTTGLHEKVKRTAVEAARRKFSLESLNRLDKVIVFHPLKRAELDELLEIERRQVQKQEEGLLFLRDTEKRSSGLDIDLPALKSGPLRTAGAQLSSDTVLFGSNGFRSEE